MKFKYPVSFSTVAFAALLLGPSLSVSGESILLSAERFVLLGGTAVTVAGPGPDVFSNGNVGSAAANPSGFPPATVVNGRVLDKNAPADATTINVALNDLITARNGLTALFSPPANNLTTVNGGNLATQILTPGVYKFDVAASISLNGILTLDAQGKNNVVWVFNIGTALTTGANAQVQFINLGTNGGSDNGLFWNAGTSFTFGANNVIAGNYLAGTDITFGTTVPGSGSASGRALALSAVSFSGAATLDVLGPPTRGDLTGGLAFNGGTVSSSGYVLLSSNGAYSQGASSVVLTPGTIYNTPGVIIDGGSANTLGNSATLTVFKTIATLTGTNTYTGGTFIDAGQLTTGSANLPANGAVTFRDSNSTGTVPQLIFNQSAAGTFGGVIAGGGSVTKNNTASLTLTGANTYTGGTTVNSGTLVASTTALPSNGAVTLADNTTLVLNQTSDGIFGGTITSTGLSTIQKTGTGGLMLTKTTSSAISLQAGSLILANNVGATTIASGAFLRGNGTVNGNLLNGGTVSPGNSPGTIVVAGNYTQTAAGTLVVEIASPASFDKLIVGGTASLAGTLELDLLGGYQPPAGQNFTIITAAGGVSGTFAPVTTNSAALTPTVNYNPNDVKVSFTQASFSTFAGTPNQVAVANAAQQNPALTAALNGVPLASQVPGAINALSPKGYQVWSDIAFAHTASLGDRLARQPFATPGHDDYYFEAAQSRGRLTGDRDVDSSIYTSDSGLAGGNHAIGENLTLGGFFEYTESDAGLGSSGSHTTVKDKMPGIRAAWKQGAWFANAVAAYGFDDYESTRAINFASTSATAQSKTHGNQWLVDVSGGRRFQAGIVSLSPFAGLQASGWKAEGFTETGAGAFNATVADQSAHSLRTQLGLEAAVGFNVGSIMLRPHARAAWIHELANDARSMNASLGALNYTVQTRDPQRDSARLSAGFDVAFSPTVSLYTDYSVQTGNTTRVLGEWRAGLSIGF